MKFTQWYFAVILSGNYKGHLATCFSEKKASKLFVYNDYSYRKQRNTKKAYKEIS